jgi:hypothetical protein
MSEDLDALAAELSDFAEPEKKTGKSARDERIVAGFEEIQRFYDQHGRSPQHGENRDIFERLYAVRLDRLRAQEDCRALLSPLDTHGLLEGTAVSTAVDQDLSEDELLEALEGMSTGEDIRDLKHVRPTAEVKAAEEIANRARCEDFDKFKPLFKQVQEELKVGERQSFTFEKYTEINQGDFFIVDGVIAYVAEVNNPFVNDDGRQDARLRLIYSSGAESNLLMRSLQKALWKDESGRRLVKPDPGPLFRDTIEEGDEQSGTLYVLRSLSTVPFIVEHRSVIHKIGVTGGQIETRIAHAALDPTFLLADVEIVASYKLAGINRTKIEKLLHRIFARAQLDLAIKDRFGNPVKPREWFMVPLKVIDEAVVRIRDGSITRVMYDPDTASLVEDE